MQFKSICSITPFSCKYSCLKPTLSIFCQSFAVKHFSLFLMASSSSSSGAFDAIIPSASTFVASSSGIKHPPFDVFINHCGQDVKQTLASRIYKSLNATGLKVFLDKPELKYGDLLPKALEEAMATATIYIAIFSEHYAESPWCLLELEYMVKTRRTIIPIFYKFDPSVLRWTVAGAEKTYIEAFHRHEEKNRYAPGALQRWKEALQQVSVCIGGIIKSIKYNNTTNSLKV